MKINQDNYEQFFLDHSEGNLSPEMEKELSEFLEANPDLKAVLDEFDPSSLESFEIHNEKLKARLRKHIIPTVNISEINADEWMIREIEGLFNESEYNELKEFLALNPAYSFDYKIFGHTKLSPDLLVSFRRKKELKKKVALIPIRRLLWELSAAAALMLIFFGIRIINQKEIKVEQQAVPAIATVPQLDSPVIAIRNNPSLQIQKNILIRETSNPQRLQLILATTIITDKTGSSSLVLAESDLSPIMVYEKKDRSLVSKVFGHILADARESISNRPKLAKRDRGDSGFWSLAKAGISGFNSISDRELELYLRKDESGKVKSYALVEEERLIIAKDLNKN